MIDLYSLRSVADAAEELGIAPVTVREHIRAGRLRATLIGRDWVTDIASIAEYRRRRDARVRGLTPDRT